MATECQECSAVCALCSWTIVWIFSIIATSMMIRARRNEGAYWLGLFEESLDTLGIVELKADWDHAFYTDL